MCLLRFIVAVVEIGDCGYCGCQLTTRIVVYIFSSALHLFGGLVRKHSQNITMI